MVPWDKSHPICFLKYEPSFRWFFFCLFVCLFCFDLRVHTWDTIALMLAVNSKAAAIFEDIQPHKQQIVQNTFNIFMQTIFFFVFSNGNLHNSSRYQLLENSLNNFKQNYPMITEFPTPPPNKNVKVYFFPNYYAQQCFKTFYSW